MPSRGGWRGASVTGTGLVYGSLWDDSERGGCQDFIRPLKRAQQMPWHVRSTDAWPTTATLSLVLSLGCVPPWLASFPPVQICISSARTPRLERSRKRYRSPRWPLCRATCLFAPKERGILPPLPSCVGVIPLDARGCCRNGQILRAKSLGTKNRKDL